MSDKFEKTFDWVILAEHLGIEVTEDEVDKVIKQLAEKDLWIDRSRYSSYEDRKEKRKECRIEELGMRAYQFRDDVESEIKLKKLREYIRNLGFKILEDMDYDEQDVKDIREFVEQHAEESPTYSGSFFEKLFEIENDYLFLRYLANNLKDLWW